MEDASEYHYEVEPAYGNKEGYWDEDYLSQGEVPTLIVP